MAFADVSGARIHLQEVGDGSHTVVLVHGLFANMALWYFSLAPALASDHRVVLYDLRGHGLSSRPESGYDLHTMCDDLATVIDATCDGPISLVGFSFGAAIAARYACDYPGRVERLVLVEPPLPMTLEALEAWLSGPAAETDVINGLPAPQRLILGRGRRKGRLVSGVLELVSSTSLRADLQREPDVPDADLMALSSDVLVCYGADSPIAQSGTRERLQRLLPDARHTTLPGGHFLPTDSRDELTNVIVTFLKTHPEAEPR